MRRGEKALDRIAHVSTLVLMDSWINARDLEDLAHAPNVVSTLVLMDSWINAQLRHPFFRIAKSFNPCFNGFMDKCSSEGTEHSPKHSRFNPCFNGFMDKCSLISVLFLLISAVSTLVLMDSWINA